MPLPSAVPPQLPLYQYQSAPVPRLPPLIPIVVEFPEQIDELMLAADIADVETVPTCTSILTQLVVLQVPSART